MEGSQTHGVYYYIKQHVYFKMQFSYRVGEYKQASSVNGYVGGGWVKCVSEMSLPMHRKQTESLSNTDQFQWLFTTGKGHQGAALLLKRVNRAIIYCP